MSTGAPALAANKKSNSVVTRPGTAVFAATRQNGVDSAFVDQVMNGNTGYRAHYSVGVTCGESFNQRLIDAVAPHIEDAKRLSEISHLQTFKFLSFLLNNFAPS